MNWINRLVVCCDCNRPTLSSIQETGFTVSQVEHTKLPKAPKFVSPGVMGTARLRHGADRLFPRERLPTGPDPGRCPGPGQDRCSRSVRLRRAAS